MPNKNSFTYKMFRRSGGSGPRTFTPGCLPSRGGTRVTSSGVAAWRARTPRFCRRARLAAAAALGGRGRGGAPVHRRPAGRRGRLEGGGPLWRGRRPGGPSRVPSDAGDAARHPGRAGRGRARDRGPECTFSALEPGARLRAHCGPSNLRLTCHLGLLVPPAGPCALRVGDGAARAWAPGRCVVFDDSYEHEVWNDTAERRVVLLVRFWAHVAASLAPPL
ncbi:unnamed protein product [Prorocentrum cordatum]|uniref:Aspartyl/asparaginy/proline hydroxylase domain-containing protein n=1 Tax=Prorocentrum cordatum TaxID=2364126 RepID=A0ABN9V8X2_9DINO|nr:unnamed protein product [Polarella glacialis]